VASAAPDVFLMTTSRIPFRRLRGRGGSPGKLPLKPPEGASGIQKGCSIASPYGSKPPQ